MKNKRIFMTASAILAFVFILCGCGKANSVKFKNVKVTVGDPLKIELSPYDDSGYAKLFDNLSEAAEELGNIGVANASIDDEYFDKYKLLAVVLPTNSQYGAEIKSITLEGNILHVNIHEVIPKSDATLLLQYKALFADIPKSEVPDGVEISLNIEERQ